MNIQPLPPTLAVVALRPDLPPRISSEQLLRSHGVLLIDHGGQRYQLRLTRENKLILTK